MGTEVQFRVTQNFWEWAVVTAAQWGAHAAVTVHLKMVKMENIMCTVAKGIISHMLSLSLIHISEPTRPKR